MPTPKSAISYWFFFLSFNILMETLADQFTNDCKSALANLECFWLRKKNTDYENFSLSNWAHLLPPRLSPNEHFQSPLKFLFSSFDPVTHSAPSLGENVSSLLFVGWGCFFHAQEALPPGPLLTKVLVFDWSDCRWLLLCFIAVHFSVSQLFYNEHTFRKTSQ